MSKVDKQVAGLAGVHGAVDEAAHEIAARAKALAAGHGGLAGDISVRRAGRYDSLVVLEHVAALSIETGHDDAVFGSGWVPGLHIMRDAARSAR